MKSYVLRRLLSTIPVALILSLVTFAILHLVPGDPVKMMMGEAGVSAVSAETMESLREQLGLNKPIWVQYWDYVSGLVVGDFGWSFRHKSSVAQLFAEQLPATIKLTLTALALSAVLGTIFGVAAALQRGKWTDTAIMLVALFGVGMPAFWFGLILLFFFSLKLGWFPVAGTTGWKSIVLPAVAVGYPSASLLARMVRSSMLDVLGQDFIRTARAKGLSERVVVYKHGLRNALIPALTMLGIQFGRLLGGTVVVETVFSRQGVGRLLVDAIMAKDYQLVQGGILISALAIVMVNLLVDMTYAGLDPRVRYD